MKFFEKQTAIYLKENSKNRENDEKKDLQSDRRRLKIRFFVYENERNNV